MCWLMTSVSSLFVTFLISYFTVDLLKGAINYASWYFILEVPINWLPYNQIGFNICLYATISLCIESPEYFATSQWYCPYFIFSFSLFSLYGNCILILVLIVTVILFIVFFFNLIFHFFAHLRKLSVAVPIMLVSSTKSTIPITWIFGKSIVRSRYHIASRTLPCETPALTFLSSEYSSPCLTQIRLSDM